MNTIPFAEFVITQIAANGMQLADSFFDGEYYVDPYRKMDGRFDSCASSPTHKDAWSLHIDGWIFKDVRLYRGPEYFEIDLTKEQKKEFIAIEKAFVAEAKEQERIAEVEKEARRKAAQDWP